MKTTQRIIMLLLLIPALGAASEQTPFPAGSRVIGHRGLGAKHWPEPENSVLALALALKEGASAVEFDVQLSSDGEPVLAHDVTLDRMTNGKGCVSRKSLTELRQLSLRDGKGERTPETVGLLSEALDAIRPFDDARRGFLADIHIKVYDGFKGDWGGLFNDFCPKTHYQELARKTLEAVRAKGLLDRVLFTSFDERVLKYIRGFEPRAKVGIITDFRTMHTVKRAIKGHYDAAVVEYKRVNHKEVELAHRNHIEVLAWSPSEVESMEKLFATDQIDGVIADSVPNALQACENSCYTSLHERVTE